MDEDETMQNPLIGRALGRLQCALMVNNHVGISVRHVTTKKNVIADRISRIKRETNLLPKFSKLLQDYPRMNSCRRFQRSVELVSAVTAALLHEKSLDPLEVANKVLNDLGKDITSSSSN